MARERVVSHSISCTVREWETIRELAEEAGKPLSRYIIDRIFSASGEEEEERGGIVLSADEQRKLRDAVLRIETLVEGLVESDNGVGLTTSIALLYEARLNEMVRIGRHEEMRDILAGIHGEEGTARIASRIYERVRQT